MRWRPTATPDEDLFDDKPYWKVNGGHFSMFINHTNSISSTHTHTHSLFYECKLKAADLEPVPCGYNFVAVGSVVGLDACHSKQQPCLLTTN